MQTEATERNAEMRDAELDEELAGILTAISVVSKRLAKKLTALQKQKESAASSTPARTEKPEPSAATTVLHR